MRAASMCHEGAQVAVDVIQLCPLRKSEKGLKIAA
jgi:hypothetical protein